jgi:hypothetical protein
MGWHLGSTFRRRSAPEGALYQIPVDLLVALLRLLVEFQLRYNMIAMGALTFQINRRSVQIGTSKRVRSNPMMIVTFPGKL